MPGAAVASVRTHFTVDAFERRTRLDRDGIMVSFWQCSDDVNYAQDELALMTTSTVDDGGESTNPIVVCKFQLADLTKPTISSQGSKNIIHNSTLELDCITKLSSQMYAESDLSLSQVNRI